MMNNAYISRLGLLAMLASLSLQVGCLSNPLRIQNRPVPSIEVKDLAVSVVEDSKPNNVVGAATNPTQVKEIEIQAGSGRYIGRERIQESQVVRGGEGINLNFKDMDLQAFIQAILGDALKQNYVIDPNVKGKVTIQTVKPLPEAELLSVVQEVLSLNGATMMLNKGRYRIVPLNRATQLPMVSRVKRLKNQGYGLQIVPLTFIGVQEMMKILQPMIRGNINVYINKRRNVLILSGSEAMLSSMIDMVDIFDVDWLAGKSVNLFSLRYVEAQDLVQELEIALGGQDGELFDGVVRLIPIERVNGILVVSHTQHYMNELASWIRRLDTANDKADKRLYVYHLKNTKAIDLAGILTDIFDGGRSSQQAIPLAQVSPNSRAVRLRSEDRGSNEKESDDDYKEMNNVPISDGDGIGLSEQSDIRIIADEVNNALVIMGTSREYEMVESAIKELDILPKQVLIEATIVEVSLTGDLNFGVEWFFKNGGVGEGKTGQGQLNLGSDGISVAAPGFSYSIIDGATDIRVVLNALESETNVQVLSSPSIMVLDNKTATINVGDEIPVPTRQSNSNIDPSAPTVNEIQYRNTGILLSVSPQINAGGLVTLEVNQEVSDAVTTETSGIDAPTIQLRTIESTVAIQSGQTVILGGLIRNKREDSVSGVPFLSRLPGLGHLFSQTANSDRRTELLVVLTPYVIANPTEARDITEEYRAKLTNPIDSVHYQP
jgi:general secretion pathway protein D